MLFEKLLGKEKSLDEVLTNSSIRLQILKNTPRSKQRVTGGNGATSLKLYE